MSRGYHIGQCRFIPLRGISSLVKDCSCKTVRLTLYPIRKYKKNIRELNTKNVILLKNSGTDKI